MSASNKFLEMPREALLDYLARQVNAFFPDGAPGSREGIASVIDEAVDRLAFCFDGVRVWRGTGFHPLHSEKNAVFLYYLSNTLYRHAGNPALCTKLFYLNKSLNGFHCFYDTELPDVFFVGHSVGIVLVRTRYPRFMVLYQGATVGKNHGAEPTLEDGLVLYPGSSIIGRCHVRAGTIVSANTAIIDTDTPGNCIVVAGTPRVVFKNPKRDILADFFFRDR